MSRRNRPFTKWTRMSPIRKTCRRRRILQPLRRRRPVHDGDVVDDVVDCPVHLKLLRQLRPLRHQLQNRHAARRFRKPRMNRSPRIPLVFCVLAVLSLRLRRPRQKSLRMYFADNYRRRFLVSPRKKALVAVGNALSKRKKLRFLFNFSLIYILG